MEKSGSSNKRRRPHGKAQDPDVHLSKLLSYALRHGAVSLRLPIGSDGFVPLSSLLVLPQFRSYSQNDIERVVSSNDKQRFTLQHSESAGGMEIRANQGHTLKYPATKTDLKARIIFATMCSAFMMTYSLGAEQRVEVELTPIGEELPHQAIHGTYLRHWPSILNHGLTRMKRTHIHLSTELPGEGNGVISGMRNDCEVAIFIDLEKAVADGINFFWSSNHVLLTPGDADGALLPKYFLKVLQLRPQRQLLPVK